MQVTALRGLTDTEYSMIHQAVKHLMFPVSLRIHRQRYAFGAIDIRPTKRTDHGFTPEQVEALIDFCRGESLVDTFQFASEHPEYVYRQGFHYLRKLA